MMLMINSYTSVLGDRAGYFLALSVVCFALATVLCWGHYGMESVRYFSGKKRYRNAFNLIYAVSVAVGSVLSSDIIWDTADFAIGAMTVINLCILVVMSGDVKKATDEYFIHK